MIDDPHVPDARTVRKADRSSRILRTQGFSPAFALGCVALVAIVGIGLVIGGIGVIGAGNMDGSTHDAPGETMGEMPSALGDVTSDRPVFALLPGDSTDPFLLLAAYSKYNDVSPLEHDARAEIMSIVAGLPGLYFAQLVGRTDRPASTVKYHTKILEREDKLKTATIFGGLRLYPPSIRPGAYAYLAATRDSATRRIIAEIERADRPRTTTGLAAAIGRAPSTVSYHLARLEEESVITRERDGEAVRVSLAPQVKELPPRGSVVQA